MTGYRFRLTVSRLFPQRWLDGNLPDATDALGQIGCDDCSFSMQGRELELAFDREHRSLQDAIASAIFHVEQAGYAVESIQLDRDAVYPLGRTISR